MEQTSSQNSRIANYLIAGNTLTALEALDKFGCIRLPSRINDLRNRGMNILTEMIEVNGKRIAKYSFLKN